MKERRPLANLDTKKPQKRRWGDTTPFHRPPPDPVRRRRRAKPCALLLPRGPARASSLRVQDPLDQISPPSSRLARASGRGKTAAAIAGAARACLSGSQGRSTTPARLDLREEATACPSAVCTYIVIDLAHNSARNGMQHA